MKKKVFALLMATMILCCAVVSVAEEGVLIQKGDYNENVIALHQKLNELGLLSLRPESPFGPQGEEALKILQEYIGVDANGYVTDTDALEQLLEVDQYVGANLAIGTSNEWSEWMVPAYNEKNKSFAVTYAELGEKQIGDYYTCQVEIEFKEVRATEGEEFVFYTQGAVDNAWDLGNIWNSSIVRLTEAPEDGVYYYTASNQITEKNVKAERFNLGFRCDYWASGSFRVKNIKVEKGTVATEWNSAE